VGFTILLKPTKRLGRLYNNYETPKYKMDAKEKKLGL
jgi:hypothetical protein